MMRAFAACLIATLATACSQKPKPIHTSVGLVVSSSHGTMTTCGFYSPACTVSSITNTAEGHEVKLAWTLQPKSGRDVYRMSITADGVTQMKDVEFTGAPVLVIDKPFKVVMESRPSW